MRIIPSWPNDDGQGMCSLPRLRGFFVRYVARLSWTKFVPWKWRMESESEICHFVTFIKEIEEESFPLLILTNSYSWIHKAMKGKYTFIHMTMALKERNKWRGSKASTVRSCFLSPSVCNVLLIGQVQLKLDTWMEVRPTARTRQSTNEWIIIRRRS